MNTHKLYALTLLLSLLSTIVLYPIASPGQQVGAVQVTADSKHDESPRLRDIAPIREQKQPQEMRRHGRVGPRQTLSNQPDPVAQTSAPSVTAPAAATSWEGIGNGFSGPAGAFSVTSAPPDTNGAAGPNHFVQIVNTSFAVFSKTGSVLYGPAAINTLWSGFGGGCQTNNDGDPTVQYDKIADRWVIMQFSVSTLPYQMCLAVSKTSDPTGAYYRYAFNWGNTNFPDYPKLAVWPDGYYLTVNIFTNGTTFAGPGFCALNRTQMLAGLSATQQCFYPGSQYGGDLPSDFDGKTLPPAGSPNYFLEFTTTSSLSLWKFHVDWTTPANTALTGPTTVPVAAFSMACNGGTCIPQSGTPQQLDSLGDRMMYRLAYRNFGDHESLVVNHSVTAGSSVGVRWYELRNPNGTPQVYQQGTYAPDSNYRWMGSIAMDKDGNMAMGYSVSSSAIFPAIRYTGRVPTDPLGIMEAETSIIEGSGSQTSSLSRWGDYSSISVDPIDDCTFWYTNEYLKTSGKFNWSTRIGSFRFSSCSQPPTVVSVSPSSGTGLTQTFGMIYSDPNGFSDLNVVQTVFNNTLNYASSCAVFYIRASNALYLFNDTASAIVGPVSPGAGTLQNSQCTINGTASSVLTSGTTLTLTLAVTFNSTFAGTKNIYLKADDNEGMTSGFQAAGTWTPAAFVAQAPSAVSVTPNSGSGLSQTFSMLYSDPNGATDLSIVQGVFNSTLTYFGGCAVWYLRPANALYLVNDGGTALLGPISPGAGTLQNSQCTISGVGSSASASGINLTLNLAVTFTSTFAGAKNIYLRADDNEGLTSGFQTAGTWTPAVFVAQPPSAVSVTPNSGVASTQTFSMTYSDPNGFADLNIVQTLFNTTLNYASGCAVWYIPSANALYLINDTGTALLGPIVPGSGTLQNTQCTINGATSSIMASGTNLTVNLAVTFSSTFTGAKNIYLRADDKENLTSNWLQLGTWTP